LVSEERKKYQKNTRKFCPNGMPLYERRRPPEKTAKCHLISLSFLQ
jgi:hypothetical protein